MFDRPSVIWGGPGHFGEYCVNIPGYDHNNFIPRSIELQLQKLLPDWDVSNRGTRLEIFFKGEYGHRDDRAVYPALHQVLGVFDVHLPTMDVLDPESGDIVNCAVIEQRPDGCYWVKPLSEAYFDERQWLSDNKAFNMAWWLIAADDKSAERSDRTYWTGHLHRLVLDSVSEEVHRLRR